MASSTLFGTLVCAVSQPVTLAFAAPSATDKGDYVNSVSYGTSGRGPTVLRGNGTEGRVRGGTIDHC